MTNDFFEYKHKVQQNKTSLEDQLALARIENQALKGEMDKVIEGSNIDANYSEETYARKSTQFAARFRKTTTKNGEELNTVKVQYAEA